MQEVFSPHDIFRAGGDEFVVVLTDVTEEELARALDIARVTMHLLPGTYSSVNGEKIYLYEHCKDRYLELVLTFRRFVDDRLQGQNTVLCIENTCGFLPFQQEGIELMLQSEHLGLTFDIGHNYKAGGGDEAFIVAHDNKLRHFHIHDCSIKSNHLAFGAGGGIGIEYVAIGIQILHVYQRHFGSGGRIIIYEYYFGRRNAIFIQMDDHGLIAGQMIICF